jgi:hypothetical protein
MRTIESPYEFVVVGGGLAGICAAVTAARLGLHTALVQDRPVLGGNASSEIRVPPVGANQCNFAYSRETGLVEELFLNNLLRNPTWNPEGWNLELETLVRSESNLDLYLNTAACDLETADAGTGPDGGAQRSIVSVKAYCSMAETWHVLRAPLFADCSGDGILGSLSGARFRYGVEARAEFDEPMCPEVPTSETMGMSLQLRARDAGRPMPFVKPAWIDLTLEEGDFGPYRPVNEHFFPDTGGFWWLEWGGELDTVHDTLHIKDEVQRITLAVWDYLKNRSPLSERLVTYELDWLGAVPGKRESRRFEGDHILTMGDVDAQAFFPDAVAYGGWGFDHHPPGGFHDKDNPSTHRYLRGPHNIPLRSLYSRNVTNLFFAGRNISATHYALSSTRVMLTCAQLGEAVGAAAARLDASCRSNRELLAPVRIAAVQDALVRADHHIHAHPASLPDDIAGEAIVAASSTFAFDAAAVSWGTETLTGPRMQLMSITTDRVEGVRLHIDVSQATRLTYRFHQGPANGSTYPEGCLMTGEVGLQAGEGQQVLLPLDCAIDRPGWHFLVLEANADVRLHVTEVPPGMLRYYPRPEDPIRPNPFSTWTLRSLPIGQQRATDADGASVLAPQWSDHALERRTQSHFLAFAYACEVLPAQHLHGPGNLVNAHSRPTNLPNLWVSAPTAFERPEWISLEWPEGRDITGVQVLFDSALHFHFGQSWQGYPVRAIPTLVREYRILATLDDGTGVTVAEVRDNHLRNRRHEVRIRGVRSLRLECLSTHGVERAHVYALRVFAATGKTACQPDESSRP